MKPRRLLRLLGTTSALVLLLTGVVQAGALPPFGLLAWPPFPGVTPARRTMIPTRLANPSGPTSAPAWHVEPVDSAGDVGWYPSLALDAAERPHISYRDWTNKTLKYAYYDGSNWLLETVPGAGYISGGVTALALDSQDRPHISYCAGDHTYDCLELRYAWHDGTTWLTETVDSGLFVGGSSALVLDAAGRPQIAYDGASGLSYAYYDGAAWITTTLEVSGHGVGAISLVLDATGRPHISYADLWYLMYAHYDGTQWMFEEVGVMGEGGCTSLALDGAGLPRIAYEAGDSPSGMGLEYAAYDGQAWSIEWVDWGTFGQYVGGGCSLALDAAERPHISYNYDYDELRYAHHDGAAWWIEKVGSENGIWTALLLDAAGRAHVSYYAGDLRYTYRLCTPVIGGAIGGPDRLPVGTTGYYTATTGPLDATPPVTLTWADGTLGPTAVYSWTVVGSETLVVTAGNSCGQAHGALTVTVCLPLSGVVITGPMVLYAGQEGTYYATPLPISATPPLTYAWDNGTVGPTATYRWATSGAQLLVVTAHNDCGSTGSATLQIQVVAWPYSSYLPVLWRE